MYQKKNICHDVKLLNCFDIAETNKNHGEGSRQRETDETADQGEVKHKGREREEK